VTHLDLLGCSVDLDTGTVQGGGPARRLTDRELALLRHLAARPHATIPRDELLVEVFGYAPGVTSRAADKAMVTLRKKVEREPWAPEHLLAVRGEGYRFVPRPEPELPLAEPQGDLVGRDQMLDELIALVVREPLVVVTGPAGVGKTRLAREVAARLPEHRVVVGSVVRARTARDVRNAITRAADLPSTDDTAALGRALALPGRPTLVVLDDGEAATEALGEVIPALLAGAPTLRVLVTSRRVLGVDAERVLRVPPLTPDDAVALLLRHVERRGWTLPSTVAEPGPVSYAGPARGMPGPGIAGSASPTAAGADTATGFSALVRCLDHLPLAIELAAPWLGVFDVGELTARIEAGAAPLSLDDVLERSFALLDPVQRRALQELTVFDEGFDVATAEAVLSPPADGRPLASVLQALALASLIQRTTREGRPRLQLLHSVRRYARIDDPELRRAHAAAFAQLGAQPESRRHRLETANLVAACRDAEDPSIAAGCLEGLRRAAVLGGFPEMVGPLADALLARALPPSVRARVLLCRCEARFDLDRTGIEDDLIEVVRLTDDPDVRARALWCRAIQIATAGDDEVALSMLEEALHGAASPRMEGEIRLAIATRARRAGDFARARREATAAANRLEQAGEPYLAANAHLELGIQYVQAGEPGPAVHHNERARSCFLEAGARQSLALLLANVAAAHRVAGHDEDALAAYAEAAEAHRAIGHAGGLAASLVAASDLRLAREELDEAEAAIVEARGLTATGPLALTRTVADLQYGRLLVSRGRVAEGLRRLRQALGELDRIGSAYLRVTARAELAVALRRAGRAEEAGVVADDALALARERGLDQSPRVRTTLARAAGEASG